MPLMRWTAFQDAHHRPFMLFANIDRRCQNRFALLSSLATAMNFKGNYSVLPEKETIRIVFELEGDAKKFADAVQARQIVLEDRWSGQWAFVFDEKLEAAMKAMLPKSVSKPGVARGGRRLNPRVLPL
jgi:hypothetical protein